MEICITPIGNAESIGLHHVSSVEKPKTTRKPKAKPDQTVSTSDEKPVVKKKEKNSDPIDLTVLFAGTCLAKDSTLNEHYDFIQFKMNDVFENWNQLAKKTYFVLKNIDESEQNQKFGLEQLQKDKYIIDESLVADETMIDFIREKKQKYDVILLLEAHNLMEVFLEGNEEEKSLFDSDIRQLYEKVKSFYDAFKIGGIMVNIHYKSADETLFFCSLEDFYTTSSIWSLDVHIFLLKVMNQLFTKLEPGIYQKQPDKNVEEVIQNCYKNTIEELVQIASELLAEEGKNQKLVRKLDEAYFKNSLEKNKTYFWEKAIFYSMTNLVKNVLKTDEEEEA